MSRVWVRAEVQVFCGFCPATIQAGAPVLKVMLPGVTRVRWRCETCAGKAPPDLPAKTERHSITKRLTPFGQILKQHAPDVTVRRVREP